MLGPTSLTADWSTSTPRHRYTATTDSTGMGGFQVISATTSWFFGVQGSGDATTTTEFRLFVGTRVNDPPSFDLSTSYVSAVVFSQDLCVCVCVWPRALLFQPHLTVSSWVLVQLDVTINDDSATVTWKPPTLNGAPSHDVNYLV